jgi:hypothetical protein
MNAQLNGSKMAKIIILMSPNEILIKMGTLFHNSCLHGLQKLNYYNQALQY